MKKVLTIFRCFEGYDESYFYSYLQELSNSNKIELINFDDSTFVQFHADNLKSKIARRIIRLEQKKLFNEAVKKYIKLFKPTVFILFKASFLEANTIELAKKNGAKVFAIYPDLEPKIHGDDYLRLISLVDLLIHTKPNLSSYFKLLNKNTICVYPFFSERKLAKIESYTNDIGISFVGHYSKGKQKKINLINDSIDENLIVYGDRWREKMRETEKLHLNDAVFGPPVYDIYKKSLFVIGLLTEKLNNFKEGDVLTARTVQIPAYGGLILHPRNKYSEDFFGENHFMLYSSITDVQKIYKTLKNDLSIRNSLFDEQQSIILNKATSIENLLNSIINNEKSNFNYFNISK
jgi:hypothetical protein